MRRPFALVLILVIASACAGRSGPVSSSPSGRLTIQAPGGPVALSVEIADTPAERARGLMGRTELASDAGMAFLWDRSVQERFWMKDTLIPLSIAFWDSGYRIVAIRDMAPCRRDPCPTYDAGVPYVGAVEVNQGFFADHDVAVGDRVELVTAHG